MSPTSRKLLNQKVADHFSNSELLTGQLHALNAVGDLLESDIPGEIGRAVLRLDVNTEGAETAVISGTELVHGDVLRSVDELFRNLFRSLDLGVQGVDDTEKGDLTLC